MVLSVQRFIYGNCSISETLLNKYSKGSLENPIFIKDSSTLFQKKKSHSRTLENLRFLAPAKGSTYTEQYV